MSCVKPENSQTHLTLKSRKVGFNVFGSSRLTTAENNRDCGGDVTWDNLLFQQELVSRTKNQPKEEVLGTDIPRTSGGHSRGYPGPKLRPGRSNSWKNKHVSADIHDPKARTSTTLRGFQKLRSEKLWAEFSFPIVIKMVPS